MALKNAGYSVVDRQDLVQLALALLPIGELGEVDLVGVLGLAGVGESRA